MLREAASRKVGESCWSHAECRRGQRHSHCAALVCKCDSGFHYYNDKCSRNIWEDLGLQQWELLLLALVATLLALAVFVSCMYYGLSKLARRYRQTLPVGEPVPTQSFGKGLSKQGSPANEGLQGVKKMEVRRVVRKSRLMDRTRRNSEAQAAVTEGRPAREQLVSHAAIAATPTDTAKFILPLCYSPTLAEDDVRRGSSSSSSSGSSGGGHGWWSPTEEEPHWRPTRRQFRRPIHTGEAGKTLRPLLLRTSTLSESDESP